MATCFMRGLGYHGSGGEGRADLSCGIVGLQENHVLRPVTSPQGQPLTAIQPQGESRQRSEDKITDTKRNN